MEILNSIQRDQRVINADDENKLQEQVLINADEDGIPDLQPIRILVQLANFMDNEQKRNEPSLDEKIQLANWFRASKY